MGFRIWIFIFLFISSSGSFAAGEMNVIGARAAGMGFSSVAISDQWSAFNNPAGLARNGKYSAGIYFENRFLVKELSLKTIVATIPVWKGTFGLTFLHDGFSLYSEMKGGVTYGMLFGKYFSAGVQLNCLRINQSEGYNDKTCFSFELGVQYKASRHLTLGVHLVNPAMTRISKDSPERLPALIRLGFVWNISDDLLTTLETEKDLQHKPIFRTGAEYHVAKPFYIRCGIVTSPTTFTFGAGLEFGSFRVDLASGYHLVLGYSPQASITYRFK